MARYDAMLIRVHSDWNNWHCAEIRLSDLHEIHWHRPTRAPHAILHGYSSCSRILNGDVFHWCDEASAPHRLHVCVLKTHTLSPVYSELIRRADARERWSSESQSLAVVRPHHRG
jgi:hypothetical protein